MLYYNFDSDEDDDTLSMQPVQQGSAPVFAPVPAN